MKRLNIVIGVMVGLAMLIVACDKQDNAGRDQVSIKQDGSSGIPFKGIDKTSKSYSFKSGPVTLIDFNDLSGGVVSSDHYASLGVYMYSSSGDLVTGPSPCNGSVALATEPFTGPYFIFNFDNPLSGVSIEAGDYGYSDADHMKLTAYSEIGAGGTELGFITADLGTGVPTGCLLLELTDIPGIKSVTVTSTGDYPNSIYLDNLTFKHVIQVTIDIKPGSNPNAFNCKNTKGLIPVAILSTPTFDATSVDHTTVMFEGAFEYHKIATVPQRHESDVNEDGLVDLVFHFLFSETTLTCESTIGELTGKTVDGIPIVGQDKIVMK